MQSKGSLTVNFLCGFLAILIWAIGDFSSSAASEGVSKTFLLAFAVSLVCAIYCAFKAAQGDDTQIIWGPVTGVVLVAILTNFSASRDVFVVLAEMSILYLTLGASVMAILVRGGNAIVLFIVGAIVGCIGVTLSNLAAASHMPLFNLVVKLQDIPQFNPFHFNFFPQPSDAELNNAVQHNVTLPGSSGFIPWRQYLFLLQTVLVSAWDAAILSIGVWIVGFFASLPINLAKKVIEASR